MRHRSPSRSPHIGGPEICTVLNEVNMLMSTRYRYCNFCTNPSSSPFPLLPPPCRLVPFLFFLRPVARVSSAEAFVAPSAFLSTSSSSQPQSAVGSRTGLSMVAANPGTKLLEQPLIADDITQLIGKVRSCGGVGSGGSGGSPG